jgi:hypothetical protein
MAQQAVTTIEDVIKMPRLDSFRISIFILVVAGAGLVTSLVGAGLSRSQTNPERFP